MARDRRAAARRSTVSCAATLATLSSLTTLTTAARADDPAPAQAAAGAPARASVRRSIVTGDLALAAGLLDETLRGDLSREERAAIVELRFVVDAWRAAGARPPAVWVVDGERPPDPDWQRGFAHARDLLVHGRYGESAAIFGELSARAPDAVAAAPAAELRALAHEAESVSPPAPASVAQPSASSAVATPPGTAARVATEDRWYGWQTLIVDGVAIVVTPLEPAFGIGTYLLGGPVVHTANGRPLIGIGDLGLRAGAPFVVGIAGALIGAAINEGNGWNSSEFGGFVLGFFTGIVSAVVIDASLLARERVPVTDDAARSAPRAASIAPLLSPRPAGGVDVGVGGTF